MSFGQGSNVSLARPQQEEPEAGPSTLPSRQASQPSPRHDSALVNSSSSIPNGSNPNASESPMSPRIQRSRRIAMARKGSEDNWQTLRDMEARSSKGGLLPATLRKPRTPNGARTPAREVFRRDSMPSDGVDVISPSTKMLSSSPPELDEAEEDRSIDERLDGNGIQSELDPASSSDAGHLEHCATPNGTSAVSQKAVGEPQQGGGLRSPSIWPPSPVVIAVTKCTIAYTVASLFTFVPTLSALLSTSSEIDAHGREIRLPNYSAHMIATVVVYYNPAKTIGGMLLATRFCVILASLATLVSLLSMATLRFFDQFSPSHGTQWDWISELGDWVVCVVWIGGSMGALAWARVWVGNPSFNTGCSMAAILVFTVVIKEGSVPRLLEVLLIVAIAATISNLTCFLIYPISSTTRLQTSISMSLTSFSTLLDRLTATFLLEKSIIKETHTSLSEAVQSHAAAFKKLKADLAEAKHERIIDSRIRGRRMILHDAAIGSLSRLAQHLAGMRGSTKLQEHLINASKEGKLAFDLQAEKGCIPKLTPSIRDAVQCSSRGEDLAEKDIAASVQLLVSFRELAGEQMDSLTSACDDALEAVRHVAHQDSSNGIELSYTRSMLSQTLQDFIKCSNRAIKRLYAGPRRERGILRDPSNDSDEDEPRDLGGILDGPNETVFLIYFFLFTLEEFARELIFLVDTVAEILDSDQMSIWSYVRSKWPSRKRISQQPTSTFLYKQLRQVVPVDPSKLQPPVFPRHHPEPHNHLADRPFSIMESLRHRFWTFGEFLRTPTIRYALKSAIGGALLAAPAYTQMGRPIFLEYRGEWALIAYISAISPTVGQTNLISVFRIIGTILGAAVAVLFYTLFPDNAIVLPILGALVSLPAFYVITQMPDYAQAGRFTLLAYNLTCLYAFNSRERDVSAMDIAFHRTVSVLAGVIWAAFVSRYWWPYTARRELRLGLSDFCLDLSYLYSKLVTTYSRGVEADPADICDRTGEEDPLLPIKINRHPHLSSGVKQFVAMELHLHGQLQSLKGLLAETKNEPRLKGPFAYEFYKEALLSCERMVDRLHSMRCVTTRDEWDQGMRESFVVPVNPQRREMVGNVVLYFYTLSAGFSLRTPMPPYLPPAEEARQQLVNGIRKLDVVKRRSVRGGGRHLLFFAYALAMQEVIAELDYLGAMMQDSFGVISQSTVGEFEALFQQPTDLV